MSLKIDVLTATTVLREATRLAESEEKLPVEWTGYAREIFRFKSKTWTPMLFTLLLAKSVNSDADTMSLKVEDDREDSYSARSLCHGVVVPVSRELGFSIRNTGNEPLNNQPFFRYQRLDEMERVRGSKDYEFFLEVAIKANALTSDEATRSLAAAVRVGLEVATAIPKPRLQSGILSPVKTQAIVESFLRENTKDRPKRLQAFVAACLDLVFDDVKSRRLNDPSRDLPGDVHVKIGSDILMAIEVRGKRVSQAEFQNFCRACSRAGIRRSGLLVYNDEQPYIDVDSLMNDVETVGVQVEYYPLPMLFLGQALFWGKTSIEIATSNFIKYWISRLQEIEVEPQSIEDLSVLVDVMKR